MERVCCSCEHRCSPCTELDPLSRTPVSEIISHRKSPLTFSGGAAFPPRSWEWCCFHPSSFGPVLLTPFLLGVVLLYPSSLVGGDALLSSFGVELLSPSSSLGPVVLSPSVLRVVVFLSSLLVGFLPGEVLLQCSVSFLFLGIGKVNLSLQESRRLSGQPRSQHMPRVAVPLSIRGSMEDGVFGSRCRRDHMKGKKWRCSREERGGERAEGGDGGRWQWSNG